MENILVNGFIIYSISLVVFLVLSIVFEVLNNENKYNLEKKEIISLFNIKFLIKLSLLLFKKDNIEDRKKILNNECLKIIEKRKKDSHFKNFVLNYKNKNNYIELIIPTMTIMNISSTKIIKEQLKMKNENVKLEYPDIGEIDKVKINSLSFSGC